MPGVMTAAEVDNFDLRSIKTSGRHGEVIKIGDIVGWDGYSNPDGSRTDVEPVIKSMVGPLVAAVGPDLARRMVVSLF